MTGKPWWFRVAACRDVHPLTFIAARGGTVQLAKSICTTCPAEEVCLWYAISLENPSDRNHVYGGSTPQERADLAERHGITQEQAREWYESEQASLRIRLRTGRG